MIYSDLIADILIHSTLIQVLMKTMKFFTNSVTKCTARIGTLTEFERMPNLAFETPLALIYTKRGSVPHLTKDVFEMVTPEKHLLSISLPSTLSMVDAIKGIDTNFANFVSMKEHINFLSIQDPAETTNSTFQQADSISIWTRNGRTVLTADKYMDTVEVFKPDFYVALCDGDTDVNSSTRRTSKAVDRSKLLLEQCLNRHMASNTLKLKGILGAVEGGYNLEARKYSISYLKDQPLMGFIIDGLHNNGPDVKKIMSEQIKEVVKYTIDMLPAEKLKVSLGCWNPVTVLDLIELGVDVFDTTYPYVATENSQALTFLCDHDSCKNTGYLMTVSDGRYKNDFSPICKECQCVACKNHTRAYLHHLHHTKEMLNLVLLMIHNTHHYLQFFNDIRQNLKAGTFEQYKSKIASKFLGDDDNNKNVAA